MASSSIVVGRVLVDLDHADLARTLLSAEDVLAHTGDSKDQGTEDDEDYARKLQDEYLQDTLRSMEDYRFAKGLAERDVESPSTPFLDQSARDYLRELLAIPQKPLNLETLVHPSGLPDLSELASVDLKDDLCTDDSLDDSDLVLEEYSAVAHEVAARAVENRQASLALAINAGLPGPSSINSISASTDLTVEFEIQRVPSPAFSRSSTDPGDPDDIDNRYERDDMDTKEDNDHLYTGDKEDGIDNEGYGMEDEGDEMEDEGEKDDRNDVDDRDNGDEMDENSRDVSPPCELDITQVLGDHFGFRTVFCMPCGDLVVGEPTLQASCGHDICVDCVQNLVATATRDESLFPPSCCHQPLSPTVLAPFLTVNLQATYDAKRIEFGTPADERIFCPNSTCSAFIGSSKDVQETARCAHCTTVVCVSCRQVAHPGDTCTENISTLAVKKLAREQLWQTCPECHSIVERTDGCNHMVCRCRSNFCYGCGRPMGQCNCR